MAKRWGAVAQANEIQIVRSVFRYGVEAKVVDRATRFEPAFKKPSAKAIHQTRRLCGISISITGTAPELQSSWEMGSGVVLSTSQTYYDEAGRVDWTADRYGSETHYTYDAAGRTIESRRQSRDETDAIVWLVNRTVYDKLGRAVASTDTYLDGTATADIFGTVYVYDAAGRVTSTRRVQGLDIALDTGQQPRTIILSTGTVISSTESSYNDLGQLTASVGSHAPGAAGPTTNYEYDSLGRQTATIGPVVSDEMTGELVRLRSETHYAADGRVDWATTNIRVVVDAEGVVQSTSTADAQTTSYQYDAQGRTVKTTFDDDSFVSRGYDAYGRLSSESYQTADGQTPLLKQYGYDDFGRLVSVTLPEVYDALGEQNDVPVYQYGYDEQGNQVSIIDPNGHETRFSYDDRGRELPRTLPIGVETTGIATDFVEQKFYDEQGRLDYEVSFEGVVTSYVYDDRQGASGRLVEKCFFDDLTAYNGGAGEPDEVVVYNYDAFGRQVEVLQDADGDLVETTTDQRVVQNTFDDRGQLVTVASPEGVIHYEYAAVTGLHTRTWTAQDTQTAEANAITDTHYVYDSLGRLDSVTQTRRNAADIDVDPITAGNQPEVTDYVYDLLGNLDQVRLPNGVVSDYDYDSLNRLDLLREFNDSNSNHVYDDGVDTLLAEYDYELAADGRRTGVTEKILVDQTLEETQIDWLYDDLGRLIQEESESDNSAYDYTTDYTYDLAGNRITKTTDQGNDTTVDEIVEYEYDANDRLLTEAKDDQTVADEDTFTVYEYGDSNEKTQQTKETVHFGDDANDPVMCPLDDGRILVVMQANDMAKQGHPLFGWSVGQRLVANVLAPVK